MEGLNKSSATGLSIETLDWRVESPHPNYRDLTIDKGFDWPKLLTEVDDYLGREQGSYYLVVFRSTRLPGNANASFIEALDNAAFVEAKTRKPDALLHYFAGNVDANGRAMSWCLWTDQESACEALSGAAHAEAAGSVHELYEEYNLERYNVSLSTEQRVIFAAG